MRTVLSGTHADQLVILDIEDCLGDFNGTGRVGYYSLADWVSACHRVGVDANVVVGEANYFPPDHPLGWRRELISDAGTVRRFKRIIPSPLKPLEIHYRETDSEKYAMTKPALESEEDYDALIAYLRLLRDNRPELVKSFRQMREEVGEGGLLTIFVPAPMEMYYIILQQEMVYHWLDFEETYRRAMKEVEETGLFLIECAAEAGADMIMFGGAGTEIFSPEMIEEGVIRPEARYAQKCRETGLFSLMHCCGCTQILLDRGWIDAVRPTVFESFTQKPLGNIDDPASAAQRLPPGTFFKGGLNLARLRNGSPEEIAAMTRSARTQFSGLPFILAGTCAVLTGTPERNLKAVSRTIEEVGDDSNS
jgi:uroporphyrinogen-III decarboxylase